MSTVRRLRPTQMFHYLVCAAIFIYLILPLAIVVPLSFNSGSFLTFPLPALSLRWYDELFESERWIGGFVRSMLLALSSSGLATVFGTAAAMGLRRATGLLPRVLRVLFLLPMVVPVVITASCLYFAFATIGLASTFFGLVVAHTIISAPFVVVAVSASLQTFDERLLRAASSLGASPAYAFRAILFPAIMPGIVTGGLFAFAASFDEVVITFLLAGPNQYTLPLQMLDGVREQMRPTIMAASTILLLVSITVLAVAEFIRRGSDIKS